MTKKKYYDDDGNQIRSKPKKRFYKQAPFWFITIPLVFITLFGINAVNEKKEIENKQTVSKSLQVNTNNDEISEILNEENEINSEFTNDEENTSDNDNNSEQDLLNGYNQLEIDYARIILMTNIPRIDPIEPVIIVNRHSAGDLIFTAVDSITFPEDVTVLWGPNNSYSNHDVTKIAYSAHGNGHITIYPFPTEYEISIEAETDEDYKKLAQEIVDNAYSAHIDPSEPHLVTEIIDSVEFIYK